MVHLACMYPLPQPLLDTVQLCAVPTQPSTDSHSAVDRQLLPCEVPHHMQGAPPHHRIPTAMAVVMIMTKVMAVTYELYQPHKLRGRHELDQLRAYQVLLSIDL
jgi:hypothetical protein